MAAEPTAGDAGRGDAGRLEELYERHAAAGFRLAYLLLGNRQAAEDCAQEAFVKAVGRLGHLRSSMAFDAYLKRTIVNLAKNTWRRRSVERAHIEADPGDRTVPSTEGSAVDRVFVWEAILGLPPRQRTAIVLRFYEDLTEDDIAAVMRCRPGTARSLVARGMASLRTAIGVHADV